jgi:sec-independent protein translocase protein TatC
MDKLSDKEHGLKSMSLGDHLDELRMRMILALAGLLIGLVICLFFGKYLIGLIESPYNRAMQGVRESAIEEGEVPEGELATITISPKYPISLESLKPGDSFQAFIQISEPDPNTVVSEEIEAESDAVLVDAVGGRGLQTINPSEGFLTYIKICLVFGLLLTSPWVFWHAWSFVSAGLYRHEKKFVHVVAPVSAILFSTGAMFFLLFIAPLAMGFFMKFNQAIMLESHWTFQSYVSMILMLTLVFGLAFQMPIVIVFAEKMGLVTIQTLVNGRKFVVVGLVVLAAVATPPDVISQISLFVPMYALFEGGIIACRILSKKKAEALADQS